jgi:hypothetical protein
VLRQRVGRPVAGGVEVEGFLDERCPLRVHDDGADVLVADKGALGEVADGRLERCAAVLVLLAQPFLISLARLFE